jgi:hypothetical protein
MMAVALIGLAQQILAPDQSNDAFSQSMALHSMSPAHSWAQLLMVAVGFIAVVASTGYALLCFVRPGEMGEDHIKRRILDDGCE